MHPCESGTWVSDVSCGVLSRWEGDEHHWYVPQYLLSAQRSISLHTSHVQHTDTQTHSYLTASMKLCCYTVKLKTSFI